MRYSNGPRRKGSWLSRKASTHPEVLLALVFVVLLVFTLIAEYWSDARATTKATDAGIIGQLTLK